MPLAPPSHPAPPHAITGAGYDGETTCRSLPKQNVGGEERTQGGQQNETPPQEPMIDRNIWRDGTALSPRFSAFFLVLLSSFLNGGVDAVRYVLVVHRIASLISCNNASDLNQSEVL